MEISFIHTKNLVHLRVNRTKFHVKGFALGLAMKQSRKATKKSPIEYQGRLIDYVLHSWWKNAITKYCEKSLISSSLRSTQ